MDIGISSAGFNILACIEVDPYCCETLRANIEREGRNTQVIECDINEIEPATLRKDLGLCEGDLDLLAGGPPCQAFSQIGKMGSLDDKRGLLLFQMRRFADAFRPRAILIEQVKGLLNAKDKDGNRGAVFNMLLDELESIGYKVSWQVINSADFGVAQARQRVFIVAVTEGCDFHFPHATHGPREGVASLFPLLPYVTVGEAISGLEQPKPRGDENDENSHVDVTPEGDQRRINGVPEGSFLAAQKHLPKSQIMNLTKKDTTKFLRLSRERVSNTLRCGEIFFHPTENRYLTPREYMRIHGYPDEYLLKGPIRGRSGRVRQLDQHRQVANSVPPPVAKSIGQEIERALSCQESSRSSAIV